MKRISVSIPKMVFVLILLTFVADVHPVYGASVNKLGGGGKETWGYVQVRPGAFMFWWLYYTSSTGDYTTKPLVLWLQGGPGASSTGYGNFEEIGPMDVNLKTRNYSWVNYTNVLFVDNPVGAGFSYVNDTKLLATNNTQIASDLMAMMTRFLEKVPEFQNVPLYIFSESYGGKMAAQFALKLQKQITKGKIKCNLKGVSLGDSWISPIDSVLTWAPFLFSTSMVDNAGFFLVNESAYAVKDALDKSQFVKATDLWDKAEGVINKCTNGVNVYNILQTNTDNEVLMSSDLTGKEIREPSSSILPSVSQILSNIFKSDLASLLNRQRAEQSNEISKEPSLTKRGYEDLHRLNKVGSRHLKQFHSDPLTKLMNGQIKQMLRIIPENVTWGGQSAQVFEALSEDFMKPVVRVVETLLNTTSINVNVYSGQLDLIVDTMGTIKWVERMKWPGIPSWKKAKRTPIILNSSTEMFVKSYNNFGFYWILKAGHMVPADAPQTAAEMMQLITKLKQRPSI